MLCLPQKYSCSSCEQNASSKSESLCGCSRHRCCMRHDQHLISSSMPSWIHTHGPVPHGSVPKSHIPLCPYCHGTTYDNHVKSPYLLWYAASPRSVRSATGSSGSSALGPAAGGWPTRDRPSGPRLACFVPRARDNSGLRARATVPLPANAMCRLAWHRFPRPVRW